MIKLSKEQYNLIKPIVKNLDEMLKNNQAEDIVIKIACYLGVKNSETDAIYSDHDSAIEDVMDYINSHYNCYVER